MNESLQLSKLAIRLLCELDEIDEEALVGEDVQNRRMEVVLEAFGGVENVIMQRPQPAAESPTDESELEN